MNRLLLIIIPILLFRSPSTAQVLRGNLLDKSTQKPVINAVIALINPKDSVLYKFTRTKADGSFEIKNIAPGTWLVLTTHPLFADYSDSIVIKDPEASLGNISLINKSKLLQEVIVKTGSPIHIKGDTTVYTADSFKVKEGASVEDLLRILPGIQVGRNGEIKAMGEKVKNVLVDGEEFFGNDPGMVIKNLQANTVQEVQVYDKKSDQAVFTGIDDDVREKTINLKMKANKKRGYFGKLEAAGGTPDNYNNSAMLNAFQGKRKLSAYGFMSNTGKTDLGWDESDKFGGGERDGMTMGVDDLSGGVWMTRSSDGEDNYYGGRNGIPKNWNAGIHYSNKYFGDSLNINSSYRYAKINAPGYSRTYSTIFLPDSSWSNNSSASSLNSREKHSLSFTIERKIDSSNTIKFINKASSNISDTRSSFYEANMDGKNSFINNSTRTAHSNNDSKKYNGTFTWNHKFNKARRTFSLLADATINHATGNNLLYSVNNYYKGSLAIKTDTTDQNNLGIADSKILTGNLVYTEPLSKYLSMGVSFNTRYNQSTNNRNVFNKTGNGYTAKVDSLSNQFVYNQSVQQPGLSISYIKKKFSFRIGSSYAMNKLTQKNESKGTTRDYRYANFYPSASVNMKLAGNKNFRLNYNGGAEAPSLQQLQPVADNTNPLTVYIGNSELRPSFRHSFSGNLSWSKPLSDNWTSFYFYGGLVQHAFTQYNRIDSVGRNIYQTVNVEGNQNLGLSADYSFSLGKAKKKWRINFSPDLSYSRNTDFVNGFRNLNKNLEYGLRLNISRDVEDKYDFSIGPEFTESQSSSSINPLSDTHYWTMGGWGDVSVFLSKKTEISSNINFSYRQKDPRFPQNSNLIKWNAYIKQYIYKKEMSLNLGIYDILNENRGYERNFNTYKFTETYYNTLKRYWLLTFTWEFTHNNKTTTQAASIAPAK